MRQFLAQYGVKFRRFPLWLMIFNMLCLGTAIAIVLVALWTILVPAENSEQLFEDGAFNAQLAERYVSDGSSELNDELLALDSETRQQAVYELINLSSVTVDVWLAKQPQSAKLVTATNKSLLDQRWQAIAECDWRQIQQKTGDQQRWQRDLWLHSLVFGSDLAKSHSLRALKKQTAIKVREDAVLRGILLNLLRTADNLSLLQSEVLELFDTGSEDAAELTKIRQLEEVLSQLKTETVKASFWTQQERIELADFLASRAVTDSMRQVATEGLALYLVYREADAAKLQASYQLLTARQKRLYWLHVCRFPRLMARIAKPELDADPRTRLFQSIALASFDSNWNLARGFYQKLTTEDQQAADFQMKFLLPLSVRLKLQQS